MLPTSDGPLIHDAIGVPPHDEWINPIGALRSWCICRPKKYRTAEKSLTDSGEQTTHFASTSSTGTADVLRGT